MKAGVSLRNHTIIILTLVFVLAGSFLVSGKVYASDPQEELILSGIGWLYYNDSEEAAYNDFMQHRAKISEAGVQKIVGYFPSHVNDLKELYPNLDYSAVSGGFNTSSQTESTELTPSLEPEAFTVEDMEDTPMWAIQVVNYRDGASTDYNKIGSLSEHEQVIVNGVASTGWYRFNTSDGTAAYVSDKYLTKEDPSNRELNIYNEETEQVDTYTFEDEDPEVIDEVIEDIKEEYENKEPVVEEPEPEEIVEPEPAEEPAVEPAVEEPSRPWQFYASIVCAVLCVVVISIAAYYLIRNKKRGRVD